MKPPVDAHTAQPMLFGSVPAGDAVQTAEPRRTFPAAALKLLTDERLARLASAGDRAAFAAIFDRHQAPLYRYCTSIVRNPEDAADALQNTMLRALHALEGDTREIALRPWLYRIAHNESISLLRRRTPADDLDGDLCDAGPDLEADAALRAQLGELLDDIRELPERQRGALVMRELAGLEYSEIAAALATSPAGAKQAIYEARRALYDLAKGREMDCEAIQRTLSDGDGRAVRGRAIRAHLRACTGCRDFGATITARRSKLAALSPAMPAGMAARMLQGVLGGGSGGSSVALVSGLAAPAAVKLSTIALIIATGAGASHVARDQTPARPGDRASAAAAAVAARASSGERGSTLGRAPALTHRGPSGLAPSDGRPERTGARPELSSSEGRGPLLAQEESVGSGRLGQSSGGGSPSVADPAPPQRRRLGRNGRGGNGGSGGDATPVRDQVQTQVINVQTQVNQVTDVAGTTVGTTVDTVRDALPVKTPRLPLAPKRRR